MSVGQVLAKATARVPNAKTDNTPNQIPSPPPRGIGLVWTLRSLGRSISPSLKAFLLTQPTTSKDTAQAISNTARTDAPNRIWLRLMNRFL